KFLFQISLNSTFTSIPQNIKNDSYYLYKNISIDQVEYIELLYYSTEPSVIINEPPFQTPATSPSASPTTSRSPSPMNKRNSIITETIWEGFRWLLLAMING